MTTHQADVGRSEQATALVEAVIREHGRIDILVNNAGVFPRAAVVDITDEEWEEVMRSNLSATFYCSRAALPHMMARGSGIIVNMGSIAGKRGSRWHAAYAAAKGGVFAFTRSLAKEAIPYGVRVNAVCPGRVETEIFGAQLDEKERARFLAEAPDRPLERAGGGGVGGAVPGEQRELLRRRGDTGRGWRIGDGLGPLILHRKGERG